MNKYETFWYLLFDQSLWGLYYPTRVHLVAFYTSSWPCNYSIWVGQNFIFSTIKSVLYSTFSPIWTLYFSTIRILLYNMGIPTGILGNSTPVVGLLILFSTIFSISDLFDLWCISIIGRLVLYFQPFKISLGLLLTPGMSVDLKIGIASHVFSAFFTKICLIV